jgi:hypothetical protein
MLVSKTYRLGSDGDSANAAADPANAYLWHFARRRLDAEAIRDAMLACAGRLDLRLPGEHPFPPIDQWGWTQHNPFKAVYPSQQRSVYLMTQRIQRHPFLALFDGPDPNVSTDVRTSATVPLQALYLMNDPFVAEQAQALADRVAGETGDERARIARAHELCWGRPPSDEELSRGSEYLAAYRKGLLRIGVATGEAQREAWSSYARVLLTAHEFVYVE